MWTLFWDMHSGGGLKEKWSKIYIEAPRKEAEIIFYNRFGHNPHRVTCTCCGPDYSIDEGKSLRELTAFHRNCGYDSKKKKYIEKKRYATYGEFISFKDYLKSKDAFFIRKEDIREEDKEGNLPTQGYVWID